MPGQATINETLANPVDLVNTLAALPSHSQTHDVQAAFDLLFAQAAQPKSLSGKACVRLCSFVEHASKSESSGLRTWAYSDELILKLFKFYLEWDESDHHRSMKLVLDNVSQLTARNPEARTKAFVTSSMVKTLVPIVTGHSTKPVVRSALKTLEHLLTKGVISWDELYATYTPFAPCVDVTLELAVWEAFVADIFEWMRRHHVCPMAGKFIACVYRGLRQRCRTPTDEPTVATWRRWFLEALRSDPERLEPIKNHIFLPLFRTDRKESLKFLEAMNQNELSVDTDSLGFDAATMLHLAALETGKRLGLVEEPALHLDKSSNSATTLTLSEAFLDNVLAHPSQEVRALALSLLVASSSTTRPYSSGSFELLRRYLPAFHADSDPKFRMEVVGLTRDMYGRVRGATHVLKRNTSRLQAKAQEGIATNESSETSTSAQAAHLTVLNSRQLQSVRDHTEFLKWYFDFLCNELIPTASYQRHITSLKVVTHILRMESDVTNKWRSPDDQSMVYDVFGSKWMRALFDLVLDRFEDVRENAASLTGSLLSDSRYRKFALSSDRIDKPAEDGLTILLERASAVARRTSRADHADGVARACQLQYRFCSGSEARLKLLSRLTMELERKVSIAEQDLGRAVLEAPLHGDFASLRLTWQVISGMEFSDQELTSLHDIQTRLVDCCDRSWSAVKDVLCDDSPEGHLPQELEDIEGFDTKGLLSYSFRSIHESSNLMRTMALDLKRSSLPYRMNPSEALFERIGNLTFNQLANLRHRGAFTTVSQTFATCCQNAKHMKAGGEANSVLLKIWYQGALNAIFTQRSTTRRSAGIPSMITGILSANAAHPSFQDVVEQLMEIAAIEAKVSEKDDQRLPQVHAYNCLKDIFINALLSSRGNQSEMYLPQCLELAASGLKSEVWAIRNCGLIFLRSLIDRLFGSHDSKARVEAGWDGKANRISYHRYPSLPNVLVNLLKSGHQILAPTASSSAAAESVFPALDIIRRAGPPDTLRAEIQSLIASYLASSVWHVREMAARTLCSCLLQDNWLQALKALFPRQRQGQDSGVQNHIHGVLLSLKFVCEKIIEIDPQRFSNDLPQLMLFLEDTRIVDNYVHCPDIVSVYVEVYNLVSGFKFSESQTPSAPELPVPESCQSALLSTQLMFSRLLSAVGGTQPLQDLQHILVDNLTTTDGALAAGLGMLPRIWNTSKRLNEENLCLCSLYVDVVLQNKCVKARTAATENLTQLLDHLIRQRLSGELSRLRLQDLWANLSRFCLDPALCNAFLRLSGCIVSVWGSQGQLGSTEFHSWATMMAEAGREDQGFDMRFAAAKSLQSFFAAPATDPWSADQIPTLLAVYDVLNDDDEEVRDVGSAIVHKMTSKALVPIEAANLLLRGLAIAFRGNALLKNVTIARMIGEPSSVTGTTQKWRSVKSRLTEALRPDDVLFAIEEQNLFFDEVRETARWLSVFKILEWDPAEPLIGALDEWLVSGLHRIRLLAEDEDGPLGWSSNPEVFAICSAVLASATTTSESSLGSEELRKSFEDLRGLIRARDTHISGLLLDLMRPAE